MRTLAFIIALLLPVLSFGQTVTMERDGTLTKHERKMIEAIDKSVIPSPDTVVVKNDSVNLGEVRITSPNTIELSPMRNQPMDSLSVEYVYLFGKQEADSTKMPPQTHILAHEMGHVIAPKIHLPILNRLGIEREAEIIGLVIGHIVFDVKGRNVGFPDSINVDGSKKSVESLRSRYCQIIKTNWSMYNLEC